MVELARISLLVHNSFYSFRMHNNILHTTVNLGHKHLLNKSKFSICIQRGSVSPFRFLYTSFIEHISFTLDHCNIAIMLSNDDDDFCGLEEIDEFFLLRSSYESHSIQ